MAAPGFVNKGGATKAVLLAVTIVGGLWLIVQLKDLLVVLAVSLTLASALAPVAEALEKRRIPRALTVMLVYLLVAVIYSAIAAYVAPAFLEQAKELYRQLPQVFSSVMVRYDDLIAKAGDTAQAVNVDVDDVRGVILNVLKKTLSTAAGLVGVALNGILVLFLTAYFVTEADRIWPALLRWIPPAHRQRWAELIRPLGGRLGGYVRGQILVSLAVGTFLAAGLTLLGVNYSLILGLLAGLLNLMPFVGSMLTAVFAILVASNQSLLLGALTFGLFALEQWLESNFIVPHLLGRQVDLHPLIVLFAILIGATLMGVVGALIAVPVAAAALFLAQELYLKPLNAEDADAPSPSGTAQSE